MAGSSARVHAAGAIGDRSRLSGHVSTAGENQGTDSSFTGFAS
jgi:hypothetical protein